MGCLLLELVSLVCDERLRYIFGQKVLSQERHVSPDYWQAKKKTKTFVG